MASYMAGEWSERGWYEYYLYALAVKEPPGTLALVAWALVELPGPAVAIPTRRRGTAPDPDGDDDPGRGELAGGFQPPHAIHPPGVPARVRPVRAPGKGGTPTACVGLDRPGARRMDGLRERPDLAALDVVLQRIRGRPRERGCPSAGEQPRLGTGPDPSEALDGDAPGGTPDAPGLLQPSRPRADRDRLRAAAAGPAGGLPRRRGLRRGFRSPVRLFRRQRVPPRRQEGLRTDARRGLPQHHPGGTITPTSGNSRRSPGPGIRSGSTTSHPSRPTPRAPASGCVHGAQGPRDDHTPQVHRPGRRGPRPARRGVRALLEYGQPAWPGGARDALAGRYVDLPTRSDRHRGHDPGSRSRTTAMARPPRTRADPGRGPALPDVRPFGDGRGAGASRGDPAARGRARCPAGSRGLRPCPDRGRCLGCPLRLGRRRRRPRRRIPPGPGPGDPGGPGPRPRPPPVARRRPAAPDPRGIPEARARGRLRG